MRVCLRFPKKKEAEKKKEEEIPTYIIHEDIETTLFDGPTTNISLLENSKLILSPRLSVFYSCPVIGKRDVTVVYIG